MLDVVGTVATRSGMWRAEALAGLIAAAEDAAGKAVL